MHANMPVNPTLSHPHTTFTTTSITTTYYFWPSLLSSDHLVTTISFLFFLSFFLFFCLARMTRCLCLSFAAANFLPSVLFFFFFPFPPSSNIPSSQTSRLDYSYANLWRGRGEGGKGAKVGEAGFSRSSRIIMSRKIFDSFFFFFFLLFSSSLFLGVFLCRQ